MDALEDNAMSVSEIADYISANYGMIIDVQIIRIKLKEYVKRAWCRRSRVEEISYTPKLAVTQMIL